MRVTRALVLSAVAGSALGLAACGDPRATDTSSAGSTTTATTASAPADASATSSGYGSTTGAGTPSGAMPSAAAATASMNAQDFVNKVAQSDATEIQTSQIAVKQAASKDVKAFAQMLVDDHRASSQTLMTTIKGTAIAAPPTTLDADHQKRVTDLSSSDKAKTGAKTGSPWDHNYLKAQIDMHNDAIDTFENYAKNGDTPALQQFATNTLPTLRKHRDRAVELEKAAADKNPVTPD